MTSRQLRLLRAASASSAATLLAALSHTFAGGAAPHPLLVLAVAALLVAPASLLIGARASRFRVALTVLLSQAVFHLVFQALGAPTGGSVVMTGHEHHLPVLGPLTAAALPDAAMLLGHVAAAVVTTLLVWHGEATARAIAGWVVAVLRRGIGPVRGDHERPAPLALDLHPLVDSVLVADVSRRGPPAVV
ncbi:MAG: hypothetical protein J7484_09935 [Microbacterium sp.]|nr:hypothetical protein [Microbacterium sp.]